MFRKFKTLKTKLDVKTKDKIYEEIKICTMKINV